MKQQNAMHFKGASWGRLSGHNDHAARKRGTRQKGCQDQGFLKSLSREARCAYTLIEMLIASVLVAALMSVVWGMMSMYNRYLTAGQTQAVEQQLIRSVLQLMEDDLQGVSVPDTNPTIVPAVEASRDFTSSGRGVQEIPLDPLPDASATDINEPSVFSGVAAAGSLVSPGRISLTGNSSSVRLSIERVTLDAQPFAAESPYDSGIDSALPQPAQETQVSFENSISVEGIAPKVAEHQTVIWQFQAPGTIAGTQSLRPGLYRIQADSLSLLTALSQQEPLPENRVSEEDASVDRTTLEALLFPAVDSRVESDSAVGDLQKIQAVPQFDVVPEIVSCRFEYFTGAAWAATWDSDQQQGLPVAIRVRLRLVTAENLAKLNQFIGGSDVLKSPLDEALNSTTSRPSQPGVEARDPAADPLASIPTRLIERIILVQPVSGPMPQPGIDENGLDAVANASMQEAMR